MIIKIADIVEKISNQGTSMDCFVFSKYLTQTGLVMHSRSEQYLIVNLCSSKKKISIPFENLVVIDEQGGFTVESDGETYSIVIVKPFLI